jgi:hypothetical protein
VPISVPVQLVNGHRAPLAAIARPTGKSDWLERLFFSADTTAKIANVAGGGF